MSDEQARIFNAMTRIRIPPTGKPDRQETGFNDGFSIYEE